MKVKMLSWDEKDVQNNGKAEVKEETVDGIQFVRIGEPSLGNALVRLSLAEIRASSLTLSEIDN